VHLAMSASKNGHAISPRRVLIVEDNPSVAFAMARAVDQAGYTSAVFHNASQALNHANLSSVEAALIDIHLPDLNGLVLASKLREILGPNAPIFVVSGDTAMENLNALPFVGATHFFSKPVSVRTLLDRLSASFESASSNGNGA
jgi:DNA-binding response OmpR family regulator